MTDFVGSRILGDVEVNEQIRTTLQASQDQAGFWWLNNGITIIAERVTGHLQEWALDDPQIVNGLQTSQEIYDYLKQPQAAPDRRHVIVRIITSPDPVLQDRIIRATNNQTKIPIQALRASDVIQRDLEILFKSNGFHYDRRKNSWRKSGLTLEKVVGMTELAQSVAAMVLQEPNFARARPSRYFKEDYDKLFKPGIQLDTFLVCALLRKRAEIYLRKVENDRNHRNNLLFYLLMAIRPIILRKRIKKKTISLASIDPNAVSEEVFQEALDIVRPIYTARGASDKAAKGGEILADLKAVLNSKFGRKKKISPPKPK